MDTSMFDALVLSGGGTKGILVLGALHYFYEKGMCSYKSIEEYAGTSVGSAICLLLVCGYEPMEIFTEIYSMENFFTVKDVVNVSRIFQSKGILSIDTFRNKIQSMIEKKLNLKTSPTFEELYNITKKTLYVCATNISKRIEVQYSYKTHPTKKCVDAVMESCSIPLLFEAILLEDGYMVDGGLTNHYPWNYISSSRKNILGIAVINKNVESKSKTLLKENNYISYLHGLITTPINLLNEVRLKMVPKTIKTVKLMWEESSMFFINSEAKMKMFLGGYNISELYTISKNIYVKGWDTIVSHSQDEISDSEWNDLIWNEDFEEYVG